MSETTPDVDAKPNDFETAWITGSDFTKVLQKLKKVSKKVLTNALEFDIITKRLAEASARLNLENDTENKTQKRDR